MPSWIRSRNGQALVPVPLRDRDDEAEVRLDHRLLRPVVAALDPLRELDLLRGREQVDLADVLEEELQRVGRDLARRARLSSSASSSTARPAARRSRSAARRGRRRTRRACRRRARARRARARSRPRRGGPAADRSREAAALPPSRAASSTGIAVAVPSGLTHQPPPFLVAAHHGSWSRAAASKTRATPSAIAPNGSSPGSCARPRALRAGRGRGSCLTRGGAGASASSMRPVQSRSTPRWKRTVAEPGTVARAGRGGENARRVVLVELPTAAATWASASPAARPGRRSKYAGGRDGPAHALEPPAVEEDRGGHRHPPGSRAPTPARRGAAEVIAGRRLNGG